MNHQTNPVDIRSGSNSVFHVTFTVFFKNKAEIKRPLWPFPNRSKIDKMDAVVGRFFARFFNQGSRDKTLGPDLAGIRPKKVEILERARPVTNEHESIGSFVTLN